MGQLFTARRCRGFAAVLTIAAVLLLEPRPASAFDYDEQFSAAVARCSAIDEDASQSGLVFNPDGFRSFYLRSQCFQDAAVQFRNASLCGKVKERRPLLFSSWGYSPARCRELVTAGVAAERSQSMVTRVMF